MLRKWSTVLLRLMWYAAQPPADQPFDPEDPMTPQTARRLAFALAPVLGATALAVQPAAAVTAPPQPTHALPSALDVAVPYQGMTFCDPVARPGVLNFARLMTSHYGVGSTGGITRACGNGVTEHSDGRAWDWMLSSTNPDQKAIADSVVAWLVAPDAQGRPGAMARRFGIMYIIWNRKQWRAYDMGRGWADYHGSSPHTDHIHFSFTWNGAMGKTSWWTGVAATSYLTGPGTATGDPGSSTPITELKYGMENDYVKALQRALGGLPITGWFGPMTQGKVREYQQAHALSVTGVAEKVMLTQLGITLPGWSNGSGSGSGSAGDLRYGTESDAVKALQRALGGLPITGWFGPMTLARVKEYQGSHRLPVTGIADLATRTALGMVGGSTGQPTTCTPSAAALAAATASNATRYTAYLDVLLRTGCSGTAVRVLQAALGGVTVDGVYGPRTQAAVASYQSANGLLATGVADRPVWLALQRRGYPYLEYRLTVLRYGSEGAAVSALQRALGINPTGWFGPITEGKVKAFQKASSITQTGVVATLTWTALDRRDGR